MHTGGPISRDSPFPSNGSDFLRSRARRSGIGCKRRHVLPALYAHLVVVEVQGIHWSKASLTAVSSRSLSRSVLLLWNEELLAEGISFQIESLAQYLVAQIMILRFSELL